MALVVVEIRLKLRAYRPPGDAPLIYAISLLIRLNITADMNNQMGDAFPPELPLAKYILATTAS